MESLKKLNMGTSYIKYYSQIPKDLQLSKEGYKNLWDLHPEEYGQIHLFNKTINTPRWFQNYGHSYKFSGMDHEAQPIPIILQPFIDYVNSLEPTFNYNGILVNWYKNGSHYIGKHSDDERSLVKNSPIYCFSFGQERKFVVDNKEEKYVYKLLNNSLIVMGGECQKYYKHSITKTKKSCNSRISVTIRAFKN